MCMSTPDIPPPPPPPQETKQPELNLLDKQRRSQRASGMVGGSLLTGASGAAGAPTGRASLLGQ